VAIGESISGNEENVAENAAFYREEISKQRESWRNESERKCICEESEKLEKWRRNLAASGGNGKSIRS
jgi:hypothetical protein